MSEQILDTTQVIERQLAVFLNGEGTLNHYHCYRASERFWIENSSILPEGMGIVTQTGNVSEDHLLEPPTQSLSFDAQNQHNHQFGWQLTATESIGVRNIRQLTITPFGIQGRQFDTDSQGQLISATELKDQALIETWQDILLQIDDYNSETNQQARALQARRNEAERALGPLMITGTITCINKVSEGDDTQTVQSVVKLVGERRKEEEKRRLEQAEAIGYLALEHYEPQTRPMQLVLPLTGRAITFHQSKKNYSN